jgi:hypothetical protein
MSNINECPAIRFVFFRAEGWLPQLYEAKEVKNGVCEAVLLPPASAGLVCVGYTVDAEGVASIAVHKLGKLGRVMGKQIVTGKILAGKTFEIVTVPHRLEQSIILGAKYFLLTRERA